MIAILFHECFSRFTSKGSPATRTYYYMRSEGENPKELVFYLPSKDPNADQKIKLKKE
ncbi:hypothetical protein P3G55_10125 [Leptospira sp. 96542]|nr:hypothetical protein [Leptospira sp. 96542]